MRLPKLVPRAVAIAAARPSCAHPLSGVLVQGALQRQPKSFAGPGADAATGPPYILPSILLLGALVHLPKLVPGAGASAAACLSCAYPLAGVMVQGAPLRHPKSVARAGADAATGPPYLRSSNLLLGALMRLPKLVPGAAPSAAACPSCAHPLAGVFLQGAPQRHPETVAGPGADAATGPPYLLPSILLLGALVHLPKLVPGARASVNACPSFAHPLAGVFVLGAPLYFFGGGIKLFLRHPQ